MNTMTKEFETTQVTTHTTIDELKAVVVDLESIATKFHSWGVRSNQNLDTAITELFNVIGILHNVELYNPEIIETKTMANSLKSAISNLSAMEQDADIPSEIIDLIFKAKKVLHKKIPDIYSFGPLSPNLSPSNQERRASAFTAVQP